VDVIEKAGGLHGFMKRSLPIITDSGGFQVFSLAYGSVAEELKSSGKKKGEGLVLKIDEEGVVFRSYRDGAKVFLTPETSIAAQKKLGADIIIPFDELPPYHMPKEKLKHSFERTHRWESRSLEAHRKDPKNQLIWGVIHGGVDPDLRKESCRILTSLGFDGYAVGGSVGKNKEEMCQMLSATLPCLPEENSRHLLGIGDLVSLQQIVPLGIDTFDSSYPTKAARHGLLLSREGNIKILKKENATCFQPIDPMCGCWTCRHYHRAYLHHLFKAKELAAFTLATLHNLHYMVDLMKEVRQKIFLDQI
jgi:queuine tRNA-ribosyltransferase